MKYKLFEIPHRWNGSTLFKSECGSLRLCIEAAVKGGAYLSGAYLRGADLRDAYLRDANLSDADLSGAYLSDADLRDADLRDAYLSDADLSGADLRGAYLRDANLSDADLSGADLRGAYLGDADLSGAYLIDAGQDCRGYQFVGHQKDGGLWIDAGCRSFSLGGARAHWAAAHDDDPALKAECIAKVELLVAVAEARGWLEKKEEAA